jgi:hypothetical protein
MHMSINKKWQVNQFEPFKKSWFVVMIFMNQSNFQYECVIKFQHV